MLIQLTVDVSRDFGLYICDAIRKFCNRYENLGIKKVELLPENPTRSLSRLLDDVELLKIPLYVIVDEYDSFVNRLLFEINPSNKDAALKQYYDKACFVDLAMF